MVSLYAGRWRTANEYGSASVVMPVYRVHPAPCAAMMAASLSVFKSAPSMYSATLAAPAVKVPPAAPPHSAPSQSAVYGSAAAVPPTHLARVLDAVSITVCVVPAMTPAAIAGLTATPFSTNSSPSFLIDSRGAKPPTLWPPAV